jgi:hypothetical protein
MARAVRENDRISYFIFEIPIYPISICESMDASKERDSLLPRKLLIVRTLLDIEGKQQFFGFVPILYLIFVLRANSETLE